MTVQPKGAFPGKGLAWDPSTNKHINLDEISKEWRAKFHNGKEAFHVPMPTIANHKEDMARVKKLRTKVATPYVDVCNTKINAEIEYLPAPVIKFRKGDDLP